MCPTSLPVLYTNCSPLFHRPLVVTTSNNFHSSLSKPVIDYMAHQDNQHIWTPPTKYEGKRFCQSVIVLPFHHLPDNLIVAGTSSQHENLLQPLGVGNGCGSVAPSSYPTSNIIWNFNLMHFDWCKRMT